MRIVEPSAKLIGALPNPQTQIEKASRTYAASKKRITVQTSEKFCREIRKTYPEMYRFAYAIFRIVTDYGTAHDIVSAHEAAYIQQRIIDSSYWDGSHTRHCVFIKPVGLTQEQEKLWYMSCQVANDHYIALLKSGATPRLARSVLPNSVRTELSMACTFEGWRKFIQLPGTLRNNPQVRPLAYSIWSQLMKKAPGVFEDLKPEKE